jgi:hypothetical protein
MYSMKIQLASLVSILLSGPFVSAAPCPEILAMNGSWSGSETSMTIRQNGSDPVRIGCKKTEMTIVQSENKFRIDRCFIDSCEDDSAFACDTRDLISEGDAILGRATDASELKKVGSCRDGVIRFEQESAIDAWSEWVIDTRSLKPTLTKTFYYWNEGTIESDPIELTARK